MVTLRNPTIEVLLGNLRETVGNIHKDGAKRAAQQERIESDAGVFWWKGNSGSPQRARSVDDIPAIRLSRPPNTIAFAGKKGDNKAVEIIIEAARMFAASAPVRTGQYKGSLRFKLNGRDISLSGLAAVQRENPLKPKETASMIISTEYAATLEAIFERRRGGGIMQRIGQTLLARYGAVASISTGGISGREIGEPWDYNTPILTAGGRGQFASKIMRPGRNMRRRARKQRAKGK